MREAGVIAINMETIRLSMKKIEDIKGKMLKRGLDGYRQKTNYLLEELLKVSPQFSGDFTANWFVVADGDMPVYKPFAGKSGTDGKGGIQALIGAHRAGDPAAITRSLQRGRSDLQKIKSLKTRIHFVNATELTSDGKTMTGPDGTVALRPENIINGGQRIESYLRALSTRK